MQNRRFRKLSKLELQIAGLILDLVLWVFIIYGAIWLYRSLK